MEEKNTIHPSLTNPICVDKNKLQVESRIGYLYLKNNMSPKNKIKK